MKSEHRMTPLVPFLLVAATAAVPACRSTSSHPRQGTESGPATTTTMNADAGVRRTMTDPEITTAVLWEIAEDAAVDASKVHVETTNGIVVLTGAVDNVLAKELATRHAEVVKGVRAVTNRIVVHAPRVPDAELARMVRGALGGDPTSNVRDLGVSAKDGVVRLTGKVSSFQQRLFAERLTKRLRGVSDVDNQLDVRWEYRRSDAEIARDVTARLRWDVLVDDGLIGIHVTGAKVRLSGVVGSAAEKSHAERDAWVSGVKAVDSSSLVVDPWTNDDRLRHDKYVLKSDAEVAQAIRDALFYDPRVTTLLVRATASGGVATLSGTVPTIAARNAAEEIARHTVGVLHVNNYLAVEPPKTVADAVLRRKVEIALSTNPFTHDDEIDVRAERGKITLEGAVDSMFESAEAESIAAETIGAQAVENRLVAGESRTAYVSDPYAYPYQPEVSTPYAGPPYPGKPDGEIAKDIESQLSWSPFVGDDPVNVAVRNGKATLTGVVDTLREKRIATETALQGGAVSVDNQLAVR